MDMTSQHLSANHRSHHVLVGGAGTPVLLLHGFPDRAELWRHQWPVLLEAGYRVIAPDLRGFGDTEAPPDVVDYRVELVLDDLDALLDALSVHEPVTVIGHDWGALVAWLYAGRRPERVARLVALSVGHPDAFRRGGFAQLRRSWYIFAFQWRGMAEHLLARDGFKALRPVAPTGLDFRRWQDDLSRPGRLTAALNWYRANFRRLDAPAVTVPTLGIWSSHDDALTERQMTASAEHVTGGWTYERFDDVGHWLQIEADERFNALLMAWLDRTVDPGELSADP